MLTHLGMESAAAALSPERVAANIKILSSARVVVAIFAGAAAGICGVHGWTGALYFLISQFIYAALAHVHARPRQLANYLPNTSSSLMWESVSQAAMTFVLFWTCVSANLLHTSHPPLALGYCTTLFTYIKRKLSPRSCVSGMRKPPQNTERNCP